MLPYKTTGCYLSILQAGLRRCCAQTLKTGFLMSRPKCNSKCHHHHHHIIHTYFIQDGINSLLCVVLACPQKYPLRSFASEFCLPSLSFIAFGFEAIWTRFFFCPVTFGYISIIIQMVKYLFSSVPCNTKFVKKRKNSTFSYCKTQKLVFFVSMK